MAEDDDRLERRLFALCSSGIVRFVPNQSSVSTCERGALKVHVTNSSLTMSPLASVDTFTDSVLLCTFSHIPLVTHLLALTIAFLPLPTAHAKQRQNGRRTGHASLQTDPRPPRQEIHLHHRRSLWCCRSHARLLLHGRHDQAGSRGRG